MAKEVMSGGHGTGFCKSFLFTYVFVPGEDYHGISSSASVDYYCIDEKYDGLIFKIEKEYAQVISSLYRCK